MMAEGWVRIHRKIFHSDDFRKQPFTDREAFVWLLCEAAYRPRQIHRQGQAISLERGQCCHSLRFLAKAWNWDNDTKVRRFLGRMKIVAALTAHTVAGLTVITICNYDLYQSDDNDTVAETVAPPVAAASQQRRKLEEREEVKKEEHRDSAKAESLVNGPPISEMVSIWNEVCAPPLPKVLNLTDTRKQKLTKRLKENFVGNMTNWRTFCHRIAGSRFLTGQAAPRPGSEKPFKASLDWVIEPRNLTKIIEGNYDDEPNPPNGPTGRYAI